MPYIPQPDREKFAPAIGELCEIVRLHGLSNGELNWLFTKISQLYIVRHGTSYNTLSDVIKALECAKLEFYRRAVAPYEDGKANQNGDVYQ